MGKGKTAFIINGQFIISCYFLFLFSESTSFSFLHFDIQRKADLNKMSYPFVSIAKIVSHFYQEHFMGK